jgi:hypothetical protein
MKTRRIYNNFDKQALVHAAPANSSLSWVAVIGYLLLCGLLFLSAIQNT